MNNQTPLTDQILDILKATEKALQEQLIKRFGEMMENRGQAHDAQQTLQGISKNYPSDIKNMCDSIEKALTIEKRQNALVAEMQAYDEALSELRRSVTAINKVIQEYPSSQAHEPRHFTH